MLRIATSILLFSFAASAQQDTLAIASVEGRGGAGSDQASLVSEAIASVSTHGLRNRESTSTGSQSALP